MKCRLSLLLCPFFVCRMYLSPARTTVASPLLPVAAVARRLAVIVKNRGVSQNALEPQQLSKVQQANICKYSGEKGRTSFFYLVFGETPRNALPICPSSSSQHRLVPCGPTAASAFSGRDPPGCSFFFFAPPDYTTASSIPITRASHAPNQPPSSVGWPAQWSSRLRHIQSRLSEMQHPCGWGSANLGQCVTRLTPLKATSINPLQALELPRCRCCIYQKKILPPQHLGPHSQP